MQDTTAAALADRLAGAGSGSTASESGGAGAVAGAEPERDAAGAVPGAESESDAARASAGGGDAAVDRAVEVGVGRNAAVAVRLAARGVDVTATDVHCYETPVTVRFVRDDVTDPDPAVYRDADVVYALNCPPELHRALRDVARLADAHCYFTTLGGDPPAVDVTPEQVPGETLYRVE